MKRIAILGSTGSIGINTLAVIKALKGEFKVVGLSTNSNHSILAAQIKEFNPKIVGVMKEPDSPLLKTGTGKRRPKVVSGIDGLIQIATHPEVDMVVMAIVGSVSLLPLIAAIKAKKEIALASKEALVSGGQVVMKAAAKNGVNILPIDSEHSAIFQCLNGRRRESLKRIYLTGSGGPLRNIPRNRFSSLTPEQVINHPKWRMGRKISVDSATLMNKGLEVIEAMWLFSASLDEIKVIIHPEAVVHSMVEFVDGSVIAQMAACDMKLPIQYALGYPKRLPLAFPLRLDFEKLIGMTFCRPDMKKFPCLGLAYSAARQGGTYPAVLNGSNEVAVLNFLDNKIKFTRIPHVIEKALSRHKGISSPGLDDILDADRWSREEARRLCSQ